MSNPDKAKVVITRWWWVRHAPVRNDGGNIYGQTDIACDTSDTEVFEAVAKILPRDAVWVASNLMRTHQTAEAIWDAGFPRPAEMPWEAAFAEQNLGQWQGMNRAAFIAARPAGSQLVRRHQRARARRREFHGPLQSRDIARSIGSRARMRAGTSSRSAMAAPSRRRSVLRSAAWSRRGWPSISTIAR